MYFGVCEYVVFVILRLRRRIILFLFINIFLFSNNIFLWKNQKQKHKLTLYYCCCCSYSVLLLKDPNLSWRSVQAESICGKIGNGRLKSFKLQFTWVINRASSKVQDCEVLQSWCHANIMRKCIYDN